MPKRSLSTGSRSASPTVSTAGALGNGNEASGEGWRYRGRGPIQLTGKDNYRSCGQGIGVDLVNEPERLESPDVGCLAAAWFWASRGLNALADAGDFVTITKRINGGTIGLEERTAFWKRAKAVFGVAAPVVAAAPRARRGMAGAATLEHAAKPAAAARKKPAKPRRMATAKAGVKAGKARVASAKKAQRRQPHLAPRLQGRRERRSRNLARLPRRRRERRPQRLASPLRRRQRRRPPSRACPPRRKRQRNPRSRALRRRGRRERRRQPSCAPQPPGRPKPKLRDLALRLHEKRGPSRRSHALRLRNGKAQVRRKLLVAKRRRRRPGRPRSPERRRLEGRAIELLNLLITTTGSVGYGP